MDTKRELRSILDSTQSALSVWLGDAMQKLHGEAWYPSVAKQGLSEDERRRIDSGQWRDAVDLDLQAILKILRHHKRQLGRADIISPERSHVIGRMIDVRNDYMGHASTRPPSPIKAAEDAGIIAEFCEFLSLTDIAQRAQDLRKNLWQLAIGREGEVVTASQVNREPTDQHRPAAGLKDYFGHTQLTHSQATAAENLENFIHSKDKSFILKGYAGTGKTFLIGGLVQYLAECKRSVVLLAPTGRAAHLLGQKHNLEASTIHKAIYSLDKMVHYEGENEEEDASYKCFFALRPNDYHQASVFIVDEASMISDFVSEHEYLRFGSGRLLKDLIDFIGFDQKDSFKKVVFIGDDAQLPPVGMGSRIIPPALNRDWLQSNYRLSVCEATLTDVVRQKADTGILKNATTVRDLLRSGRYAGYKFDDSSPDTRNLDREDFFRTFLELHGPKPNDLLVMLVNSNAQADEYNEYCRKHFFPGSTGPQPGDRIMVTKNNVLSRVPLFNGQSGSIVWAAETVEERMAFVGKKGTREKQPVPLRFRDVEMVFRLGKNGENQEERRVSVNGLILDNVLTPMDKKEARVLEKALYMDFMNRHKRLKPDTPEFKEALREDQYFNALRIKYGYAITCHKAQGGEWPTVFVDCKGRARLDAESLRWTYTAFTRASEKLLVTAAHDLGVLKAKKGEVGGEVSEPSVESPSETTTDPGDAAKRLVTSRLENWAISNVIKRQWLVQMKVSSAQDRALLMINYKGDNCVSKIRIEKATTPAVQQALDAALRPLLGINLATIHDEGIPEEPANPIAEKFPEFVNELSTACQGEGITPSPVKLHTQYHATYQFMRNTAQCSVDFFFNGKGTMTKIDKIRGDAALCDTMRTMFS